LVRKGQGGVPEQAILAWAIDFRSGDDL
jgi:hypothetical protein